MQFQVPQFIEVEDKIFGPLTLKQFLYLAGGGGLAYLSNRFLPTFIAIFVVMACIGLGVALAFVKINRKPFVYIVEALIRFLTRSRLYVWKKEAKKKKSEEESEASEQQVPTFVPGLSESKLKDLAWSLDIHDKKVTEEVMSKQRKGYEKEVTNEM